MNNGTTSNDITNYYETVPSNYLETMLWIEADRMGFLLDTLDIAKLNAQRDIVKNERRQSVDNQPYGRVYEDPVAATYPASHPYSWPVIGSMEDLSAASEEDVKSFFRLYYAPNNAILTIVGDFDPAQAKEWVTKYFGDIPRGNAIKRPVVAAVTLQAGHRLVYGRSRAGASALHSVAYRRRKERRPICAVGARRDSLRSADGASDQSARLRRAGGGVGFGEPEYVRGRRRVHGDDHATARPFADRSRSCGRRGHRAAEARGPDRRRSAKGDGRRGAVLRSRLESNLGKAFQLANGAAIHGDPGHFRVDYQKTLAVTPADVQRVANKYLTAGRVVLSVVPMGKSIRPRSRLKARRSNDAARFLCSWLSALAALSSCPLPFFCPRSLRPRRRSIARNSRQSASLPSCAFPPGRKSKLSNGAELIVSEKHDLPLVSFSITFLGGADQFETGRQARRGRPHRVDDERGDEDARRRGALERAAAPRNERLGAYRKRERIGQLRRARPQSSRRRWTSWPTCS